MIEAESAPKEVAPKNVQWRTAAIHLPPHEDMNADELKATLGDTAQGRREIPLEIGALHFGRELSLLHLPGEAFTEYQLFAQSLRPDALVAVAAYGDCGPGYICREQSFGEGGYEPTDSFVVPRSEQMLKGAIMQVMR